MTQYIDGFILPIPRKHLESYRSIVEQVAEIWKEYGALSYQEFVGDDLHLEGTRSFIEVLDLQIDEVAIFGWVVFPSKEVRDKANTQVPLDSRMESLIRPLIDPNRLIFNAARMVYGGFSPLIRSD